MNAIAPLADSTALAIVAANPVAVFTDPERFDAFYTAIAAEVRAHVPDTATKKGRDAIASLAYRVAKTKTGIDEAGKKLNEDARAQINVVDAVRRSIRDKLDALRDEARKPLAEWEAADAERVAECRRTIDAIKAATVVSADDTSDTVATRLAEMMAVTIAEARYDELAPEATGLLDTARATLAAAHVRLLQQEADARELAALRAAAAERAEADRLAKIEADRIEAERIAAEKAEAKRLADAAAEAERIASAAAEAVRKAREEAAAADAAREAQRLAAAREVERKAAAAQDERDRQHAADLARVEREKAAEIARVQRIADDAEAARKTEVARQEKADADMRAASQRKRDEDERRAANHRHRHAVMTKAVDALMKNAELSEDQARAAFTAIAADKVPACSVRF